MTLFLVLLAGSAFADYKEHYKEGMKAYDLKKWGEVIRRMQSAIGEKPQEGEQILLYGLRSEAYLPHFYLGVAHQKTGDCGAAVAAWRESERQGALKKATRLYREYQSMRALCPDREVTPPPGPDPAFGVAAAEAEKAITDAEFVARAVLGLKSDADLGELWKFDPSIRSRESEMMGGVEAAKHQLASARAQNSAAGARSAAAAAAAARSEAESFRRDLMARKPEVAERNALLRELAGRASEAENLLRKISVGTPQAVTASANLRKVVQQIRGVNGPFAVSVVQLRSMQRDVGTAMSQLRSLLNVPTPPTPAGPPPALVNAVRSYFSGDYGLTESLLRTIDFGDQNARAQALLIRGAARYAMYVIGGETNRRLHDQALSDVRECRSLNGAAKPDPRFFSPRFTSFFNSATP